jgi:hypothetical protein
MTLVTRLSTAFDNSALNTLQRDPILPPNDTGAVLLFAPENTLTNPNPEVDGVLSAGQYTNLVDGKALTTGSVNYTSSYGSVNRHSVAHPSASSGFPPTFTSANQGHDFVMLQWIWNGKYPSGTYWGAPTIVRGGTGDLNAPAQSFFLFYNVAINQPYAQSTSQFFMCNTDRFDVTNVDANGVFTITTAGEGQPINAGNIWIGMGIAYMYADSFAQSNSTPFAGSLDSHDSTKKGILLRVKHVPGNTFNGATLTGTQCVLEVRSISGDDTSWVTLTSANMPQDSNSVAYTSGYLMSSIDDRGGDGFDTITGLSNFNTATPHEKVALVGLNWQKNTVDPAVTANGGYSNIWQVRTRSRYDGSNSGWTSFANNPEMGPGPKGICLGYHSDSSSSAPTGTYNEPAITHSALGSGDRPWRYWRFYIEDLTLSGRTAEQVYDLEWNNNSARIQALAATIPTGDPNP